MGLHCWKANLVMRNSLTEINYRSDHDRQTDGAVVAAIVFVVDFRASYSPHQVLADNEVVVF